MEKSPDAFRTISEVADHLETPAHVLRFWESRFPQIKPVKRAGGRRYYRPSDVALLAGIKRLLHDEGMTIRGVQKMLREQGVRQVAAFGSDSAALEEVFAVDERLLEGIPGVGPEPPSAEILSFQSHQRAADEAVSVTDPNLREGEAADGGPEVRLPRPVLPPVPVTALEVQGEDETTLSQAIGPVSPPEGPASAEAGAPAGDLAAAEEAPFLDTEADPDWQQDEGTAELHRLHAGAETEEGFFAGPEADWEPEDEAGAERDGERGAEPEEEVPAAEDLADLAALDGAGVEDLVAGVEAVPADGAPVAGSEANGTEAETGPDAAALVDGRDEVAAAETEDLASDNVFGEPGALEAWAEQGAASARRDEGGDLSPPPVAAPAPQGDLWSAAGLAAPPPLPPRTRGADLLAEETDDLLDVDLSPVLPVLTRLRAASREGLAEHGAELAALHERLLALREAMASAARVRAR